MMDETQDEGTSDREPGIAPEIAVLRAMTPAQRHAAARRLYETARRLQRAAIRQRHPEVDDETVERLVREGVLYARD